MTSYIIHSSDKDLRQTYAQDFCKKSLIDAFDITTLQLETEEKAKKTILKQSIGIEEIKKLQEKLSLKPMRSPQKAVIINDAQFLTIEAQNAMLKTLEEPPEQTVILLTTDSTESLLPTILSRCTVVTLKEEKKEVLPKDEDEFIQFFTSLHTFSVAQAMETAEKIGKSKQEALTWLETAIHVIRNNYFEGKENQALAVKGVKQLQEAHTLIKTTNINVRMTLEVVFLSLISNK